MNDVVCVQDNADHTNDVSYICTVANQGLAPNVNPGEWQVWNTQYWTEQQMMKYAVNKLRCSYISHVNAGGAIWADGTIDSSSENDADRYGTVQRVDDYLDSNPKHYPIAPESIWK